VIAALRIAPALAAVLAVAPLGALSAQDPQTFSLTQAKDEAEHQLRQTFTNLTFEDFGPSPVAGPLYQAAAGGRIVYYAPQTGHILFGTVYDRSGVNVTALAEQERGRRQLSAIDTDKALAIGPATAPTVIEFTDPDCPYCRALDRFWAAKASEGKPVRRLIYFVSGIHPRSAAKAEHILCSADKRAAFNALYAGEEPKSLAKCPEGKAKVEADALLVRRLGIGGTPTLIVDGKIVSGFQQAELEAFLGASTQKPPKAGP
jgi:thiol:disulfide interchange protein DsbC